MVERAHFAPAQQARVGVAVTAGIDIGTSSVKAVAVDDDGAVLARTRVSHSVSAPTPTRLEHEAKAWRTGPATALADLHARIGSIDAACVAAMVPSLTAVDAQGRPITPGLLYGDDRGWSEGAGTASPATSGEGRALWAWTAAAAPNAAGIWPAQSVANNALVGRPVLDAASAAALYPLYNGVAWDEAELASLGSRLDLVPEVMPMGVAAGEHQGTTIASGTVDALGEQAVSGVAGPGDVLVVLGSTLLVWAVIDEWREADRLWSIPHTTPGQFLIGGASNAGGLFRDLVRRLLGLEEHDQDPPVDGLEADDVPTWEPYPRGERTPLHDRDRRAVLHGLALTHGPAALLRAAHEASGFVVRHHLELAGVQAERLVVTGGGSRSADWVQAIADATGVTTDVVAVPEGGALGAAWVARMAAGLEDDLAAAKRWAGVARRVEPTDPWTTACQHRWEQFRSRAG